VAAGRRACLRCRSVDWLGPLSLPDGQLAPDGVTRLEGAFFRLTPEPGRIPCYSEPAQPAADALKAVLAFPATYTVGITSLGYQVVLAEPWPARVTRRAAFVHTTQGSIRLTATCDLFRAFVELGSFDAPCCSIFSSVQHIPLWRQRARRARSRLVFGRAGADRQPRAARALFRCAAARDGELPAPASSMRPGPPGSAPGERLRALAAVPGVYVPAALNAPPLPARTAQPAGPSSRSAAASRPGWPTTWRGNTLSHFSDGDHAEAAWPSIHMVEVVRKLPGALPLLPGQLPHPAVPHPASLTERP